MSYISVKVSNVSGDYVRLELADSDDGSGKYVELDAGSIEGLISELAAARALLSDEVSKTLEPSGSRFGNGHFQADPDWHLHDSITWEGEKLSGVTPLALRHSGIGWLLFAFPNESAGKIGQSLIDYARRTK